MNNRVSVIRDSISKVVRMLSERKLEITQRGSNAYVKYDEKTLAPVLINIPYIPNDASETFINAIQGFLDHEVAHVLFSDPAALAESKKRGVAGLHNIIEDSFIERQMAKKFSGSGINLRNVGEFFLKEFTDKELAAHPEQTDALLIVPAIRAWSGSTVYIDYMKDKWHLIKGMTDRLGESVHEVENCNSSWDCVDLAEKFNNLLSREDEPPSESGGEGDSGNSQPADSKPSSKGKKKKSDKKEKVEKEKSDSGKNNENSDFTNDESDDESEGEESESENKENSSDDSGSLDSDTGESGNSSDKEGGPGDHDNDSGGSGDGDWDSSHSDNDTEVDESNPSGSNEVSGSTLGKFDLKGFAENLKDYDEAVTSALSKLAGEEMADSKYAVFTTDFDKIEPLQDVSHVSQSVVTRMESQMDHMVGPLQKDLERLIAAKSKVVWSPGHRSGKLNASALARLVTFNDDRAFRRKQESTSKDVAVSLLVDCSGSMGGGKIRTASYAAYALSAVLCRIGISNEVLGFTTGYQIPDPNIYNDEIRYARYESLYIPIIKGFQERMLPDIKKRFAALPGADWLNNNVDGESVAIAANRLSQRKEARKILMVLSDGQPAAHGGGRYSLNGHLRNTVKEIEKAGIDVLGIGIESDAVRSFYSKHIILNNVSELPTQVMGEMKRLLIK